jgi:hypothetical protein
VDGRYFNYALGSLSVVTAMYLSFIALSVIFKRSSCISLYESNYVNRKVTERKHNTELLTRVFLFIEILYLKHNNKRHRRTTSLLSLTFGPRYDNYFIAGIILLSNIIEQMFEMSLND